MKRSGGGYIAGGSTSNNESEAFPKDNLSSLRDIENITINNMCKYICIVFIFLMSLRLGALS